MAIPDLDEHGHLPPGLHRATVEEVVARFCVGSEQRRRLERPLRLLVEVAVDAAALALYLNGSFVTDSASPADIDAAIVLPDDFDTQGVCSRRLRDLHRVYGLDIERVAAHDTEERDYLLNVFFGFSREGVPRGLLEVAL